MSAPAGFAGLGLEEAPEVARFVESAARVRAGFAPHLAALAAEVHDDLRARGELQPGAPVPALALPATLEEVAAIAIAVEEGEGDPARAQAVRQHYLETMPRLTAAMLATRRAPEARFFHAPLDWERLPRLRGALDRLFALAPAGTTLAGFSSTAALAAGCPTLHALYERTYYGRLMPPLHGYPHDLAYYARALDGGLALEEVLERYLAAPLLHELTHFDERRAALFPLYLDECVAGYLGIHVMPEFAYPRAGEDAAIFAAPWFAQVGQALCRVAGLERVVAAQAGAVPFAAALPPGLLAAMQRLGWRDWWEARHVHFLTDPMRPDPWLKLLYLGAAGRLDEGDPRQASLAALEALPWRDIPAPPEDPFDRRLVEDALRAMCLDNRLVDQHYVVAAAPPPAPVEVDLDQCRVSTALRPGTIEPAPPSYLFSPSLAARLRGTGVRRARVVLDEVGAVGDAARALVDGREARGRGFAVTFGA